MNLSKELKQVVLKILNPFELRRVFKAQKNRKKMKRARSDAQLKLYSELLKGDYLHYGYFKDPDTRPEDVSFNDIEQAQDDYAKLFLERVEDRESPILDVGCGMGGLSNMLQKEGLNPVALTPDRNQIAYIGKKYPGIEIIQGKFEEIGVRENQGRFGTLITSESLQYLKLGPSLKIIDQILKPSGTWLVCDYFRKGAAHEKSGHPWPRFLEAIQKTGFDIAHQRDITPNILVTLKYAHMWANRIGLPIMNFTIDKFRTKQPGYYYLLQDLIEKIKHSADDGIEVVNPDRFQAEKKYLFLVIKRKK